MNSHAFALVSKTSVSAVPPLEYFGPATWTRTRILGFVDPCSVQLSYGRNYLVRNKEFASSSLASQASALLYKLIPNLAEPTGIEPVNHPGQGSVLPLNDGSKLGRGGRSLTFDVHPVGSVLQTDVTQTTVTSPRLNWSRRLDSNQRYS